MRDLNRRLFLRGGAAAVLGCSAAASPWLTTVTLAGGAPAFGDKRLVVVILRGAMDGLDALRPVGDPLSVAIARRLHGPPQGWHCAGKGAVAISVFSTRMIPHRPLVTPKPPMSRHR